MDQYLFQFVDDARARRFVERLVIGVLDVAIYIDGRDVQVVDGGELPQRERIYQLAKSSGAHLIELPSRDAPARPPR